MVPLQRNQPARVLLRACCGCELNPDGPQSLPTTAPHRIYPNFCFFKISIHSFFYVLRKGNEVYSVRMSSRGMGRYVNVSVTVIVSVLQRQRKSVPQKEWLCISNLFPAKVFIHLCFVVFLSTFSFLQSKSFKCILSCDGN